ncbi:MAG: thermonuclease family protein [Steroidobacteraceae bacterium]
MAFPIHYTPESLALGDKPKWVSATDGDTPTIQLPVRMLGMDAPELHYGGATETNPGKFDAAFASFLAKEGKNLDPKLKAYLAPRLKNKAGTRHIAAGKIASDHFQVMAAERLQRVSATGKELTPRHLFTMVATEVFDKYGRMLAYINASYTKVERDTVPVKQRQTFNLQMMADGHATSLVIYPNIPKPIDLELVRQAMAKARKDKLGLWKSATPLLNAFEFRWIIDTISGKRQGPDRFCGDFTTGKLYPPQRYFEVLPENRLWFFAEDVGEAYAMGFTLV